MIHPLTRDQVRILALLEQGLTLEDIGEQVGYSRRHLKRQIARIRAVMGVPTTVAAVATYVRHDEIDTALARIREVSA